MVNIVLNTNDPGFLLDEIRKRMPEAMRPVAIELVARIGLVIGNDDDEWTFHQFRNGGNSFALYRPGEQYHFRYYHQGEIQVKDSYMNGRVIASLRTRKDVKDWVASLV